MYSAYLLLVDKMGNCGDRRILARKDCFLQAKNNDWIRVFFYRTVRKEKTGIATVGNLRKVV